MLALAVAAEIVRKGFSSWAALRLIFFSLETTGLLTFAHSCNMFIALASEALHHCTVFNEEVTVLERPLVQ